VAYGKLNPRFLKFEHGFRAAGEACNRGKLFNSAGITPRRCLENCGMTLLDLRELLTATADNQPADLQANNRWSEYMWFGTESRYGMGTFDNAEVSFKSGDTFRGPRFRHTVTLQSPAAARYGGTIAKTMQSECYFEAYGSRDTRVLSELYINWLCRDQMREHHGFFEHRDSCGEEGLRGPMRQADGALRRMYDAVRGDAVLARIFSIGQGCRMGSDGWEWETETEPTGTLGRVDGGGVSDGDSDGGSGGDSDGGGGGSRGHGGAGGSQGAAALTLVTLASQFVPAASSAVASPPPSPPPPSPASDGVAVQYEYYLTLLVLTTIRQHNFDLRCELFACLLFASILVLWCCAAAPTAGCAQRCARWLLARLQPHHLTRERVAACVLVLSHLWSHGCRGAAAQAVCAALVLALRSCSWSERAAGQLIHGLLVQGAVVAHTFAAPTAERLGALELQLFWEIVELVGLHLLVEWARSRLLRWLSRRLHLYPRCLDLEPRRLDLEPTEVD
jgi:hypothetical protein